MNRAPAPIPPQGRMPHTLTPRIDGAATTTGAVGGATGAAAVAGAVSTTTGSGAAGGGADWAKATEVTRTTASRLTMNERIWLLRVRVDSKRRQPSQQRTCQSEDRRRDRLFSRSHDPWSRPNAVRTDSNAAIERRPDCPRASCSRAKRGCAATYEMCSSEPRPGPRRPSRAARRAWVRWAARALVARSGPARVRA